jgi:hypothetical protein
MTEIWRRKSELRMRPDPIKSLGSMSIEEMEELQMERSPIRRLTKIREAEEAERLKMEQIHEQEFSKLPEVLAEDQAWREEDKLYYEAGVNLVHRRAKELLHQERRKELKRKWQAGELFQDRAPEDQT